ncbi:MAG TPA: hypothetical protein VHJ20_06910 [Polyangia bacterium]|nr:hypothetical protein [Polyangia bacterium]
MGEAADGDLFAEAGHLDGAAGDDGAVGARDEVAAAVDAHDVAEDRWARLDRDQLTARGADDVRRQAGAFDEARPAAGGDDDGARLDDLAVELDAGRDAALDDDAADVAALQKARAGERGGLRERAGELVRALSILHPAEMNRGARFPGARSVILAVILGGGCSGLPDGQELTSAHFRYHARADVVLDPGIMDRLERHRTEIDDFYGIESGVIDYYLFRDHDDFMASSPCPSAGACTLGRSVYAYIPFFEHELVHGLFADAGEPARVVSEGLAEHAACIAPEIAFGVSPNEWPAAVEGPDYGFGQELVSWMLATGGTARFVHFYGESLTTSDPAIFALQFERYWGRRLPDVAIELKGSRFAGSSCPCAAPSLPLDGSPSSFVGEQDYRTVDVPQESRLLLTSGGGQFVFPSACNNALIDGPDLPNLPQSSRGSLTVAHVGPGRYGVTGESGTLSVGQKQTAQSVWSCEAAAADPIDARGGDVTAWATSDVARGQTWMALRIDGPRTIDMLNEETVYRVCPACPTLAGPAVECVDLLSAVTSDNYVVTPPASGIVMVSIGAQALGSGVSAQDTSVGIRLRATP